MKKIRVMFYAICLMFLFESTAFAYIDPSVMTYAIQAVAGIVIAIGAVVGIVWRSAKKKARAALNINENAKKEVEEDVVEIDPNSNLEN